MTNFIYRENKTFEQWFPLVLKSHLYIICLGPEFVTEAVREDLGHLLD